MTIVVGKSHTPTPYRGFFNNLFEWWRPVVIATRRVPERRWGGPALSAQVD
jgi:hypothetical protein